mgnify:CR=1 FL=1
MCILPEFAVLLYADVLNVEEPLKKEDLDNSAILRRGCPIIHGPSRDTRDERLQVPKSGNINEYQNYVTLKCHGGPII